MMGHGDGRPGTPGPGGGGGGAGGGADLEVGGARALAQDVARHAAVEPGVGRRHLQLRV